MKRIFFLSVFIISINIFPQIKISGKVTDTHGTGLPAANVYIKDSYDGATSDTSGSYSFITTENGEKILLASYIGYKTFELKINLDAKIKKEFKINIQLEEVFTELNTVVISAGSFEASDEKKSIILRPLDIVTTGSQADVYSALNTLPGSQQIGEQEGMFVRGGDAVESKVFIDEMLVQKPFFSSIPDIPSRGRFSAFYFKGTVFSTGGYSAQYGQALSSALILKTEDLPDQTFSAISLMPLGIGASHTQRWENSSISTEINYYDLKPYFAFTPQRQKYERAPISGDVNLMFRLKPSSTGIIKLYGYYNTSVTKMYLPNLDAPVEDRLDLYNKDFYLNANYKDVFGEWAVFIGTSFNNDKDDIKLNLNDIIEGTRLFTGKSVISHPLFNRNTITFGAEATSITFDERFNIYKRKISHITSAGFVESDIFISKDFAARIGVRYEYSNILAKSNFAPRTSLAYKLGNYGQVNFAYGRFFQLPEKDYLYITNKLDYENADHYIINYQFIEDDINFRIEGYYKDYKDLVKGSLPFARGWNDFTVLQNIPVTNLGKGYAKGIDVFWRDRLFINNTDYWLSYSYLDTKREYKNYPTIAIPPFAAKHTFSFVLKHYVESISTSFGLTYTHATGRTYYNPNNQNFLSDRTKSYNNLSLNAAYLTYLLGNYTVIFFSVDNLPGFANIYGYRYSSDGVRNMAIIPTQLRAFFIGCFINFTYK
ncbi:MAG: TonB-dependent receptor [Syntrophothermus sp.]